MAAIYQTAYPRLKSHYETSELIKSYSPTLEELSFCKKNTRSKRSQFGLLTHLKVFQRLGYFVLWEAIPPPITKHIASCLGDIFELEPPNNYDESGTRNRYMEYIRKFVGVRSVSSATTVCFKKAAREAVKTKEHIPDIINIMLEELIRHNFELPGFSTLERAAHKIRFKYNESCFENIVSKLLPGQIEVINHLLEPPLKGESSRWHLLKQEPDKPTASTIRTYTAHVDGLLKWNALLAIEIDLPDAKHEQFYHEAYAADWTHINQIEDKRRYSYVLILVQRQTAKAIDNLVTLFIKQVKRLHNKAALTLEKYKLDQAEQATDLVERLLRITKAFKSEGSPDQRFAAIEKTMPEEPQTIIDKCLDHLAITQNNELFFLPKLYKRILCKRLLKK